MRAKMDGKCAEEDLKRQEENLILRTEMCARLDEGLKQGGNCMEAGAE